MKAGGRVFGVDTWDAEDTPFDGQWATENSSREDVSGRVEVMHYGDPHYLTYKEEVFDVVCTSWIDSDEVAYYNALSEMTRVLRPGGRLVFIQSLPTPTNLTEQHLQDLGLSDIRSRLVQTGYLFDRVLGATKPTDFLHTPAKIDKKEDEGTDESPGFEPSSGACMIWLLSGVGLYLVFVYMSVVYLSWGTLGVPDSVDNTNSLAVGFMAENSVWFCWSAVEIHLALTARPLYMVKRVGIFALWFRYGLQYLCMVLIFNAVTWLPIMLVDLATGVNSVALRTVFRVLLRPLIGITLDCFFQYRQQLLFLQFYKPDYGSSANRYKKSRKRTKHRVRLTDALLGSLHDDI
eukprot:TRINITY_DN17775_c0_g1_i3.p1 TRINITY_DN17775_c0_g1~~TRINITY_DN17775_c0_g1_i3.p1  ORF type:complete len:348 (+),score=91.36 TRINITY_DN17775_c0_g1_i3:498-1541(+)